MALNIFFILVTFNRKKRSINAKSSIEFNTNNQGAVQAIDASEEKAIETAADATSLGIEILRFVNKDIVIGNQYSFLFTST